MARKFKFLFLGVCLLIGALGFVGCDLLGKTDETEKPDLGGNISALVGTWDSGSDSYTITTTTIVYDDGSNGEWGFSYKGNICHVSNFNAVSGVVIIEYTEAPTSGTSGNFIGIYYRDLTATTVKLANSYDPEGTETATLDTAKAKFTQGNADTLVSWTYVQPQTKQ